jgi:hypothetical protein
MPKIEHRSKLFSKPPWGVNAYATYSWAYYDAATTLVKKHWRDGTEEPNVDWMILPVLFLLHHFVELQLKEIILLSHSIGSDMGVPVQAMPKSGSHDLTRLLKMVDLNLKGLEPNLEGLNLHQAPFLSREGRDLIVDLQEFGSSGEALRYPRKTPKQGGGVYVSKRFRHVVVNVPAVMTIVKDIRGEFTGTIGYLSDISEADSDYLS